MPRCWPGMAELRDLDVRPRIAHEACRVLVVLHLPVHQRPAQDVPVERDGRLDVGDREGEVPDAVALHGQCSCPSAPPETWAASSWLKSRSCALVWMNSTRMPSGSIMYTARPPVLGPMVGVTGGLTALTPLAMSSS